MSYIQLIEVESPSYDELMKLHEQWLKDTEARARSWAYGFARTAIGRAPIS